MRKRWYRYEEENAQCMFEQLKHIKRAHPTLVQELENYEGEFVRNVGMRDVSEVFAEGKILLQKNSRRLKHALLEIRYYDKNGKFIYGDSFSPPRYFTKGGWLRFNKRQNRKVNRMELEFDVRAVHRE